MEQSNRDILMGIGERADTIGGHRISHNHNGKLLWESIIDLAKVCIKQETRINQLEAELTATLKALNKKIVRHPA